MKACTIGIIAVALALSSFGAQVDIFTAQDLQHVAEAPPAKGASYADHSLARYGNHYLLLVTRKQTGSAEVHEHESDIFVVERGAAAIVTGGKIVGGQTTKPGEIRGSGIEGGERHSLNTGDIIHIPSGVPHQLQLTPGKPFSYFVVKVSDR